jgi:hypothetical protein
MAVRGSTAATIGLRRRLLGRAALPTLNNGERLSLKIPAGNGNQAIAFLFR